MTENPLGLSPVFIVGCPRSGTTLLRTMLARHPEVLAHPEEPQFILGLFLRFGSKIDDVNEAVAYVSGHKYFPKSIDPSYLRAAFEGVRATTLQQFIHRYVSIWGEASLAKKRPIIKHPELVFHLNMISRLFPHAAILHIVRDPRSNVLSQRKRWPRFSVLDCAMTWKNSVRHARIWGIRNRERFIEIKYEDLVIDPKATLTRVLAEIGLPFDPGVLDFEYQATEYSSGKSVGEIPYRNVDPSRIELWRKALSSLDIRLIEWGTSEEMKRWDYQPLAPQVNPAVLFLKIMMQSVRFALMAAGREAKSFTRIVVWRAGLRSRSV